MNIFFDYAKKTKNTAWSYFLPMLNRQDLFTVHMVSITTPPTSLQLSPEVKWKEREGGGIWEEMVKGSFLRERLRNVEEEEKIDYSKAYFLGCFQNDQKVICMKITFPFLCGLSYKVY